MREDPNYPVWKQRPNINAVPNAGPVVINGVRVPRAKYEWCINKAGNVVAIVMRNNHDANPSARDERYEWRMRRQMERDNIVPYYQDKQGWETEREQLIAKRRKEQEAFMDDYRKAVKTDAAKAVESAGEAQEALLNKLVDGLAKKAK